jgi:hypothetical protein
MYSIQEEWVRIMKRHIMFRICPDEENPDTLDFQLLIFLEKWTRPYSNEANK